MAWQYVAKPMEFSLLFTNGLLLGLSCDASAHTGIKSLRVYVNAGTAPVTGESKFY